MKYIIIFLFLFSSLNAQQPVRGIDLTESAKDSIASIAADTATILRSDMSDSLNLNVSRVINAKGYGFLPSASKSVNRIALYDAISAANDGDILDLGIGSFNIDSTITYTKDITIQGRGNQTIIYPQIPYNTTTRQRAFWAKGSDIDTVKTSKRINMWDRYFIADTGDASSWSNGAVFRFILLICFSFCYVIC